MGPGYLTIRLRKLYEEFVQEFSDLLGSGLEKITITELEKDFSPFLLTEALVNLYLSFNGSSNKFGEDFLTLEKAIEERGKYFELFKSEQLEFPRGLFPVCVYNYGNYWVPLSRERTKDSPVFEFAISDGDQEIYQIYNSVELFIRTLVQENKTRVKNKYPGTKGHYIDEKALDAVRSSLNPDIYQSNQKTNKSKNGIVNMYDIENLPKEWM